MSRLNPWLLQPGVKQTDVLLRDRWQQSPIMAETSMSTWRADMIRAKIDTRRETFMPGRKAMGEAREVMDRITAALSETKDFKAAADCYSTDAVGVTPDQGEITGRDAIVEYLRQFSGSFPDLRYEYVAKHESGNVAIDEGYVVGTNTASLPLPSGESIPATGKQIRVRSCDVVTVDGGMATSHRFYFDQMEFLSQLGLAPETPS